MDTINLVFKLVNNLKYYLEIDGVMVFPKKHQSEYCIFQIDSPLRYIVTQARTFEYISTDGASGTSLGRSSVHACHSHSTHWNIVKWLIVILDL